MQEPLQESADSSESSPIAVPGIGLENGVRVGALLLHGLTGLPSEMRPLQKALTKMGCKVSVPLLAGHGASHKELLQVKWPQWVDSARQALKDLTETCDRVIVGGLSMGAGISVLLAEENDKVDGIFLMSSTLIYDGEMIKSPSHLLWLVDLWPSYLGSHFWWDELPPYGLKDPKLQKLISKQIKASEAGVADGFGQFRTYAGSMRQMCFLIDEVKKKAHKVTCPALIVHSLEDTLTTMKNAVEMYKLLGSKEKSLTLLDGCDHVITLDLKRDEVAERVCGLAQYVSEQARKSR